MKLEMFAASGLICRLCGSCRTFSTLKRMAPSLVSGQGHQIRRKNSAPLNNEESEVPGPMSSRYETFRDENSPVILDIEEERRIIQEEEEKKIQDEFEGINLERGVTGVFEIEEVVNILRREKGKDIFVCRVPEEYNYVQYLVIATAGSSRHMLAMLEFIRKIFKKKMANNDHLPMLEGKNSKNWMAIDLGNIAVHIFSQNDRKTYDLETLWSVGREFDSEYQNNLANTNILTQYSNLLSSLTPNDSGKSNK